MSTDCTTQVIQRQALISQLYNHGQYAIEKASQKAVSHGAKSL